ncbi:hypothetical protein CGRA01v4_00963 [Colletotrichum graminicola]|uniref:Uncharacterized protein n=1 Tax=Colletotrichum graminicola (strain M1.001 / M2 / FGSC 10212) TaxID=645133 RepID=E3QGY4_COLGM|nr:uncharacterized protein GLRG_05266 [Colletotrichum graminicola M1.001]EFQ30122.1 hypothetical protein GLRG_05266 [Colletotrichum graminicola M1.001]WDK09685.1 hypothetical protein CGRA01v4_00963 [Colletotrichum graminicola]
MDTTSNTSIVNGDASSSRAADPNETRRLQDQRLQLFLGDDESPNPMLPRTTTSDEQHKKEMSEKINKTMSKAQKRVT